MRVIQLEKIIMMINEMEILIRFRAMRTKEIIDEIYEQESFKNFIFLDNFKFYVDEEKDNVVDSWRRAVEKTMFLNEMDKLILINIGEQIGSTDIEGQLSMLNINKGKIQHNLNEAEESFAVKGKMLKTVWPLIGIVISLVII